MKKLQQTVVYQRKELALLRMKLGVVTGDKKDLQELAAQARTERVRMEGMVQKMKSVKKSIQDLLDQAEEESKSQRRT